MRKWDPNKAAPSLAHQPSRRTHLTRGRTFGSPLRRDKDGNGTLDKEEVKEALQALGFTFVDDKEINKIFKRADSDKNGA